MRRNIDVKVLLFNNRIYGLTKGQVSPTSEIGKKTKSTPHGSPDQPFNPPLLALGSGATFVARTIDVEGAHMGAVLKAAAESRGQQLIEIYQNCPVFNDGAFTFLTEKAVKADVQLRMEQGKPLLYGKDMKKGIRFNPETVSLEVVTLGENGITEKDILVHDATREDPAIAYMLAELATRPGFPTPIGVFRDVKQPDRRGAHLADDRGRQGQEGRGRPGQAARRAATAGRSGDPPSVLLTLESARPRGRALFFRSHGAVAGRRGGGRRRRARAVEREVDASEWPIRRAEIRSPSGR